MNSSLAQRIRIVLVEPSHPGNIGAAARAMKTMGLSKLVLVRPKRFPDPQAEWRAAGARDVLERVSTTSNLREAISDATFVVGTTARARRMAWRQLSPRLAAPEILVKAEHGEVAVIFGREADGLSNDELDLCHLHVCIPASSAYGSLNLAMAVQVVCYELRCAYLEGQGEAMHPLAWDRPRATSEQVEHLFAHLESLTNSLEFLPGEHHTVVMRRIRRMIGRIEPDVTEVSMLRGILSAIEKQIHRA
ncbi:MAG: RNA methyltransferase [Gammaproteobacteria bacterium]|nr:RNA methyltransferase [Gammaproteobacteria bacterium]